MDKLMLISEISTIITNVFVIVSVVIAVIQLSRLKATNEREKKSLELANNSFRADNLRKLRQSTIDFYNEINKETMPLIDMILVERKELVVTEILASPQLEKDIRRYLTLMERFSVGINSYMYDLQVFDRMQGRTTLMVYEKLKPYIENCKALYGDYFYGDFESLITKIEEQRKKRESQGYNGVAEKFEQL